VSRKTIVISSVVDPDPERDPDPKGSEPFCSFRIRIRIIGSDPDPKGSGYQFYVVKEEFSCFKSSIFSESTCTKILTLKLVARRTLSPKVKFLHSKSFDLQRI